MATLIELIKILRDRTGAGMMDCKKALVENNEDIEKAIDWLREKGIAKAAKKSSRIAAEGATHVRYCADCHKTLIFEINCETDFVAKSDAFKDLIVKSADAIMCSEIHCIDCCKKAVEPLFNDAVIKLGEKLDFRRYEIINTAPENGVGTYIHMGGKISVLVVLEKDNPELAKGIAMTIAASNPTYISKEDIPEDVIARETAVQLESARNDERLKGKPEAALAKIVEGKVNKALAESIAVEQEYVLDPSKKIKDVLAGNKLVKFIRYQVGEGLEKRVDNFAEEVMNQAK
jgi:elongation factor Ts